MTWGLLLILAAVVFCNRYLLLEPRLPLRFPDRLKRSLNYSAPCLLSRRRSADCI
jgi:branched-subunit amino acid transport protein